MDELDEQTAQSLFFLGIRQLVPFQIGCSRYVTIFRTPNLRSPSLSKNFCNFLNAEPRDPVRYPHLGVAFDFDLYYQHVKTRNCLSVIDNILFESSGPSIRMIEKPLTVDNWSRISPSISTRSICTSLSLNKSSAFGIASTLKNSVIFTTTNDPVPRFMSTTFLEEDSDDLPRTTDVKVNSFINGESLTILENGTITLYSENEIVTKLDMPVENGFVLSSIEFASHPRVVAASFADSIQILDLRHENPGQDLINCPIQNVSSILSIDMHQIAVSSMSGIDIIDLRFPTESSSQFDYRFTSLPTSLFLEKIENSGRVFESIIAQCCESSEVLFFPYTESEFSAPLRPFDVIMKPYETLEPECLTGISILNKTSFLQFESGAVIGVELTPDEPPRRHFFTTIMREEDGNHRDTFKFQPQFAAFQSAEFNRKSEFDGFKWDNAFPEISTKPIQNIFYKPPEIEKPEDPGTKGYLIEEDDALLLGDEDVPTALSLFWENHIEIARNAM